MSSGETNAAFLFSLDGLWQKTTDSPCYSKSVRLMYINLTDFVLYLCRERVKHMKKENNQFNHLEHEDTMFRYVLDALRLVNPRYGEEEKRYLAACDILKAEIGNTVSPGAADYISAKERAFSSDALYAAWQGFLLNLRIFQNPVNALMLGEDFEDLHQERRMHTLPLAAEAQKTIDSFYQNIPIEKRKLTEAIEDYFAYLETVGYKLAHYIGFVFGNRFLPNVVHGYTADEVITSRYSGMLREVLQMEIEKVL